MKFLKLKALLLLSLFTLSYGQSNAEQKDWKYYYTKAEITSFYSATVLNGYYDLKLPNLFLDSATESLKTIENLGELNLAKEKIGQLRSEIAISTSIAEDNMNYRYPAFSLMSGHRPEFNTVDDAEEALIESVIDKALNTADPLLKGMLKDNPHFLLFNIQPFDETLYTVGLDYFGVHTPFYAIRLHELESILGVSGYDRLKANTLDSNDYAQLMRFYGVDRMILLTVRDNGSGMPGMFYKGITFQTVQMPKAKPTYVSYFEGFRIDKSGSSKTATLIYILNTLIILIFLLGLSSVKIQSKPFRTSFFLTKEMLKSMALLVFGSIVAVYLSYNASSFLETDINQFHGETHAKAWVLYQILMPTILSIIITYLLQYKFSKEVVNSSNGFARILFVSFLFPTVLISYFEYYAELMPTSFIKYIVIAPAIMFIPCAILGGNLLNAIFKKEKWQLSALTLLSISLILWFVSIWCDLRDWDFESLILVAIASGLSWAGLYIKTHVKTNNTDSSGFNQFDFGLLNPASYFSKGLNHSEALSSIHDFVQNDAGLVFHLHGELGMGKSRLIKELMQGAKRENVFYFGDCNEFIEGSAQLYEPFFNAYCQHSGFVGSLPKGFFVDRSGLGKNLSKAVSMVGSAAPIDVGAVLNIEDDGASRSLQEISSELIEQLISRINDHGLEKQILIIDDCQWMDQGTEELLVSFIKQIKLRSKYTKQFKIILVSETVFDQNGIFAKLLQDTELLSVVAFELKMIDPMAFVGSVLNSTDFRIYNNDQQVYTFASILKNHLNHLCEEETKRAGFTPGDFFGYLAAMEQKGYLKIDSGILRLSGETPSVEDINLKSGKSKLMSNAIDTLESNDQLLLESAAYCGFKFDAEVLAKIWNKDVIEIIQNLERLEKSGFVIDLSEEDNLYSFKDKELHKIIRTRFNKDEDTDQNMRQLVIEYQKRIIESIIKKGEQYIQSLDIEILQSAIERCFKYDKIDSIKKHTPLIGLYAALKYVQVGKIKKGAETLLKVYPMINQINSNQKQIIVKILNLAGEVSDLSDFDQMVDKWTGNAEVQNKTQAEKIAFIDDLLNRIRPNQSEASDDYEQLLHILLRDVYKRLRGKDETTKQALNMRLNRIQSLTDTVQNADNQLRIAFYLHLIQGAQSDLLEQMYLSALDQASFKLAGEISRHLALINANTPDKQLTYTYLSLMLTSGVTDTQLLRQKQGEVSESMIRQLIIQLIEKSNLNTQKALDLNYSISRVRDYCFNMAKTLGDTYYEHCIFYCDLAYNLSKKLNDERGFEMAISYKGAALYHLKRYQDSLNVYYHDYFEWLITKTKEKDRFNYIIEGIGLNCMALNDFSIYESVKKELYEHLMYISNNMQNQVLEHSLFDKSKLLREIMPQNAQNNLEGGMSSDDHGNQSIKEILNLLICIAHADGDVDPSERHDLTESAIALAYYLNLPHQHIKSISDAVFNTVSSSNEDDRLKGFETSCQWLKANESVHFSKAVLQLCWDMVNADGIVTDEERKYIQSAQHILKT